MLVELSVVEQRYHAVMEVVCGGVPVVEEVAERYGVSRKTVHAWLRRITVRTESRACCCRIGVNSQLSERELILTGIGGSHLHPRALRQRRAEYRRARGGRRRECTGDSSLYAANGQVEQVELRRYPQTCCARLTDEVHA